MTTYRLHFCGKIMKSDSRMAGDKPIIELSICKKNTTKQGEEPTFSWIRVTIWQPPEWITSKAIKGAFISGSGEFSMRSYEKDGVKHTNAEVRCGSYDCEIAGDDREQAQAPAPVAPKAHAKPVHRTAAPQVADDVPFARSDLELI